MKITTEQWSALRRAAFDDDARRFEALAEQIVRQRIREHQDVVDRRQPARCTPYLINHR